MPTASDEAETAVREALCSLDGFSLPDEPWSESAKTGFLVLGLTSKQMPLLAKQCGKQLGCSVSPMALLEYPTPLELAAHLAELPKSGKKEQATAEAQAAAAKRLTSTGTTGGTAQKSLRVLALHGQYVNATIMQMATTPLVAAARRLGMKLEIVCTNGPIKHTVSDLKGQIPDDPLWSLWGLRDVYRWSEHDDSSGTRQLPDADKAVAHLEGLINELGPFDGAIGFSNGAAVLQLALRTFQASDKGDMLRFGVFFGPCAPGWQTQKSELYATPSLTPSFVVGGAKDDYCGKYVEMYEKEDRAGLLSHLKSKGVDKLKERKTFATLVEEAASK